MNEVSSTDPVLNANRTLTMVIYGLYGLGLFTGGVTSLVAVIMNHVKYDDVRGHWLETHFRWQIRTFWFMVLWATLLGLFIVGTFFLGAFVAWIPWVALLIWYVYRVVKGFLYLNDGKPLYPAMNPPAGTTATN